MNHTATSELGDPGKLGLHRVDSHIELGQVHDVRKVRVKVNVVLLKQFESLSDVDVRWILAVVRFVGAKENLEQLPIQLNDSLDNRRHTTVMSNIIS